MDEDTCIWDTFIGDGRGLLILTGLVLFFSGAFALFLTFFGYFLPHDQVHMGYTAPELSIIAPNLVKFMFHDRAAFGGVLLSLGSLYIWLVAYPISNGQRWAWYTFAISCGTGFLSFLAYIGYGYLDTWHGIATLFLLPVFLIGIIRSYRITKPTSNFRMFLGLKGTFDLIRKEKSMLFLLVYAIGLILAGLTIATVGMTFIFVPSDIEFIAICGTDTKDLSDDILGVIAHDRAGFGGCLATVGVTVWLILLNASRSISLWQTLLLSGLFGFSTAIGIHFYIGYTDFVHLLPAYIGAAIYSIGMMCARKDMILNQTAGTAP